MEPGYDSPPLPVIRSASPRRNRPAVQDVEITTPDGRVLTGRSVGPAGGRPVLFVAGAATGKSMTFGDELIDRYGVRLLTMDRPGMGGSTPHPDRTLASTANDYRTFLDGLLGQAPITVPVVAHSQGSVFALALGCAGSAERLVLVSPADEVSYPATRLMLPPELIHLADLAASSPDEAARILQRLSAEDMEKMVLAGSPPSDADFYLSEPFNSRYRQSLAEGFANNGSGYIRDTLIAMAPWEVNLSRMTCPVHILFGAEDHTHSPDQGRTLSQRIPGATSQIIPAVGGALLWTHADIVFARMLQRVTN